MARYVLLQQFRSDYRYLTTSRFSVSTPTSTFEPALRPMPSPTPSSVSPGQPPASRNVSADVTASLPPSTLFSISAAVFAHVPAALRYKIVLVSECVLKGVPTMPSTSTVPVPFPAEAPGRGSLPKRLLVSAQLVSRLVSLMVTLLPGPMLSK
jgi:hypothetical protein